MEPLTERLFAQVREYQRAPKPEKLIVAQQNSLRDVLATVPAHGAREKLPMPPETNLIDVVVEAIRTLGDESETFPVPEIPSVQVEWINQCRNPGMADSDIHGCEAIASPATADSQTPSTILYLHGGQFWYVPWPRNTKSS
jgi:hypothetical protein